MGKHVIVVEEVGAALEMRQSPGAESTDKPIHEHVVIAKLLANRAYQNLVRTVDKISSDFHPEGWRPPFLPNLQNDQSGLVVSHHNKAKLKVLLSGGRFPLRG